MNRLAVTGITINQNDYIAYIALGEKREFIDFQLFEPEEDSLVGRIIIARVEHILPNIQAAFVRITPKQKCYLPLSEAEDGIFVKKQSKRKPLCEGDELLVQVTRDAVRAKDPVVSTHLSISGRYAVLTTGKAKTALCVSKKLPEDIRMMRREQMERLCPEHEREGYGMVLRTNSSQAGDEEIEEDIRSLVNHFHAIVDGSKHLSAYANLYSNAPGYVRRLQAIRDFGKSGESAPARTGHIRTYYDGIYTDSPEIYDRIAESLPYLADQELLHLYTDEQVSLSSLYNIKGNIDKLLSPKVWLPSGANLIIESVEAMTIIDVNTAKNMKTPKGGQAKEQTVLKVNKEAAAEIARQLRLRNISGIIVVDFINMESRESGRELEAFLKSELDKDTVPCCFIDTTKLGLVEITRKKVHRSLADCINDN